MRTKNPGRSVAGSCLTQWADCPIHAEPVHGFAARAGCSDQETADTIIARRREQGENIAKALRPDYIARTIEQARSNSVAPPARARDVPAEPLPLPRLDGPCGLVLEVESAYETPAKTHLTASVYLGTVGAGTVSLTSTPTSLKQAVTALIGKLKTHGKKRKVSKRDRLAIAEWLESVVVKRRAFRNLARKVQACNAVPSRGEGPMDVTVYDAVVKALDIRFASKTDGTVWSEAQGRAFKAPEFSALVLDEAVAAVEESGDWSPSPDPVKSTRLVKVLMARVWSRLWRHLPSEVSDTGLGPDSGRARLFRSLVVRLLTKPFLYRTSKREECRREFSIAGLIDECKFGPHWTPLAGVDAWVRLDDGRVWLAIRFPIFDQVLGKGYRPPDTPTVANQRMLRILFDRYGLSAKGAGIPCDRLPDGNRLVVLDPTLVFEACPDTGATPCHTATSGKNDTASQTAETKTPTEQRCDDA